MAAKEKTCRANVAARGEPPRPCGEPIGKRMLACCSEHRAKTIPVDGENGIYYRGGRYVWRYRDATRRQRWESARTLKVARVRKRKRETEADDGEHAETRAPLRDYALAWIENYTGRTRRGFREETRDEYRRQLTHYLLRYPPFDGKMMKDVKPGDLQRFVGWLEREQPKPLSDATVQRIMAPVKAMFATAYELEDLRRNPAARVRLSNRAAAEVVDDDEDVRWLTRAELAGFLSAVDQRWRTFYWFLAATGLRISEAVGLEWRHMQLTGPSPHVKIRQRIVRGRVGAPKTKRGKREIPLAGELVVALIEARRLSEWPRERDPVFASMTGTPLTPTNVHSRILNPAADAAGVPGIGFHAFRHTCASMLIDEGRSIVQVSRWLGHADPAFTLRVYAQLMDEGIGAPLDLKIATQTPTPREPGSVSPSRTPHNAT